MGSFFKNFEIFSILYMFNPHFLIISPLINPALIYEAAPQNIPEAVHGITYIPPLTDVGFPEHRRAVSAPEAL